MVGWLANQLVGWLVSWLVGQQLSEEPLPSKPNFEQYFQLQLLFDGNDLTTQQRRENEFENRPVVGIEILYDVGNMGGWVAFDMMFGMMAFHV